MSFDFSDPSWLWLLTLVPLTWLMARRSLAGLTPLRWYMAVCLRSMVILLLVLALAGVRWRTTTNAMGVIFAMDASDSIPSTPSTVRRAMTAFVQDAIKTRAGDDAVGVVAFARQAALEHPPTVDMPANFRGNALLATDATDIAGALRLSAAAFPQSSRKRIVLLSDGNENRGSALAEVDALRVRGIALDVLPVHYLHENEIALESMVLPERILPNTPFRVRAVIRSGKNATVDLQLLRDNMIKGSAVTELRPGKNAVIFTVPGEDGTKEFLKGLLTYTLRVIPKQPEDDRAAINNVAHAFTTMKGPPQVLYIDGNTTDPGYTTSSLLTTLMAAYADRNRAKGLPGIAFDYRPFGAAELPDVDMLARYDAIILDNISADDLGDARMRRMRMLVQDFGTGLIMLGGENSFGAGNYRRRSLEDALPVEMDLKHRKVIPNGALLLAIDCSGSMDGDKLVQAKLAAREAARALSPYDYIGIVAFDAEATWLLKPIRANNQEKIRRYIDRLGPAGGTNIVGALEETLKGAHLVSASYKHIVLLSDGQAPEEGLADVMKRVAAAGVTVSTVGIGEQDGQKMMESISQLGHGRYFFVKDPKDLPRIFIRESLTVKRGLIHDMEFTPDITAVPSFLAGVMDAPMRPLWGYVSVSPREKAVVSLTVPGEEHDPIFAHWRYGLGMSVAFTSDVKERWGVDWVGWEGFSAFWSAVVQETIRKDSPGQVLVRSAYRDGAVHVTVEATDTAGIPEAGLSLAVCVNAPDAERLQMPLKETGSGRYEATMAVEGAGRHMLSVSGTTLSGEPRAAFGGFVVPSGAEMEKLEPDLAFLHELARRAGGHVLSGDAVADNVFRRDMEAVEAFRDLWRMCLVLAAICFFLDVFFRRVQIPYEALLAPVVSRFPALRRVVMGRMPQRKMTLNGRDVPPPYDLLNRQGGAVPFGAGEMSSAKSGVSDEASARLFAASSEATETTDTDIPSEAVDENAYTSRMLSAKKRARDRMK